MLYGIAALCSGLLLAGYHGRVSRRLAANYVGAHRGPDDKPRSETFPEEAPRREWKTASLALVVASAVLTYGATTGS